MNLGDNVFPEAGRRAGHARPADARRVRGELLRKLADLFFFPLSGRWPPPGGRQLPVLMLLA